MAGISTGDITSDLGNVELTIANAESLSGALDLKATRAHRLNIGAAWTAAAITFQVSDDGENWRDLYNSSGEFGIASAQVGADRSILLDYPSFYGIRHLKLRSGTAAAAVNQGAERTLTISTVPR